MNRSLHRFRNPDRSIGAMPDFRARHSNSREQGIREPLQALQVLTDLPLFRPGEASIPIRDPAHWRREQDTEDLDGLGHPPDDLAWRDSDRSYDARRSASPDRLECRLQGQPAGDAVIDDNHGLSCPGGCSTASVPALLELDHLSFERDFTLDGSPGDTPIRDDTIVQYDGSAGANGSHCLIGVRRDSDLPDVTEVERSIQCPGDFARDRDATQRQADHDQVRCAFQPCQLTCQDLASMLPISK